MSQTVLITGASSGFGRDTSETLARGGHHVFASMRDVAGRNRPTAEALRANGIKVVDLDVTDDASVERGVASALEQAGRLDVLINNAGIGSAGVSEAFTADQLRDLFDVNVFGVQRGVASGVADIPTPGRGASGECRLDPGRVTLPLFRSLWRIEIRAGGVDGELPLRAVSVGR